MDTTTIEPNNKLVAKDFASNQEVKWCPGCGDYSILKQVQTVFPDLGIPKEKFVFISGIGCSSRFTYYMDTYGIHSIHGRAAAIASGVKLANPDLDVWVISGDGDALSIGGNHFIHAMRKNFIPFGSIEEPFNPTELALGAKASFVARSMDRDPKHLQAVLKRAHAFKGTSFVEVYTNCTVFNDEAFFAYSDKETKKDSAIFLEHGKPLIFGHNDEKGIVLEGHIPRIVNLKETTISPDSLWIHDEKDKTKANLISRFFDTEFNGEHFPRPFGVIYADERPLYEEQVTESIKQVAAKKGKVSLNDILSGDKTWTI